MIDETMLAQEMSEENLIPEAMETEDGLDGLGTDAQEDTPHGEADANAQLEADIRTLHEDGWSIEQLQAFAMDEQARADVAAGRSARQAATAYLMRLSGAGRRRGVPTLRAVTTDGSPERGRVERMSAGEFAKFSDDVYGRVMAGEKIKF